MIDLDYYTIFYYEVKKYIDDIIYNLYIENQNNEFLLSIN